MSERPSHGLGWQDGELAALVRCGDEDISKRDVTLNADTRWDGSERDQQCPNCGKFLRLIWDVRVEEIDYPTNEETR